MSPSAAERPELTQLDPELRTERGGPAQHAAALIGFLILIGLGTWQLQRLQWKTALIAQIAASVSAPPGPLAEALGRSDPDYAHVILDCPTLTTTPVVRLYSVSDDGPARRAITACPIAAGPYRSILVDRGFLKGGELTAPAAAAPTGPIVGLLQKPEKTSPFAPVHTSAGQDWYSRDIAGMAKELSAERPAPLILLLERPAPEGGDPAPSATPKTLSNNHLGYALTWYGLAAALAGVYIAFLRRQRR